MEFRESEIEMQKNNSENSVFTIHNTFFISISKRIKFLSILTFIFLSYPPVYAAEKIDFEYKKIPFSISIQDLEAFAKEREVSDQFNFYLAWLRPSQKDRLFNFLNSSYKISPSGIKHVLQEPMFVQLLHSIGEVIQSPPGQNGDRNLKVSLLKSAKLPTGFSPLMVIKNFPKDIQLDTEAIQKIIDQRSELDQKTKIVVKNLEKMSEGLTTAKPVSKINLLPKLEQLGQFQVDRRTLTLQDRSRKRNFLAHIYFPTGANTSKTKLPVILIENGLWGKLDRLQLVARYLSSHGFAVAISEHPGSDYNHQQKFLKGLSREIFKSQEFIDRPLDVSFLLNELERLNQSDFKGMLQTQRVGVLGFSLGATTALALAGSSINFSNLKRDCGSHSPLVNFSLLFQCRALEIPHKTYNLKDKRIQAIFVLFPFSNSVYGKTGMNQIQIPTWWQALAEDSVTPLLIEQIPSFQTISSHKKYFGVLSGFPHFDLKTFILSTANETGQKNRAKESKQLEWALSNFSLAFFKTYISNNLSYMPYLTPTYIKEISKKSNYGVSFLEFLPENYSGS